MGELRQARGEICRPRTEDWRMKRSTFYVHHSTPGPEGQPRVLRQTFWVLCPATRRNLHAPQRVQRSAAVLNRSGWKKKPASKGLGVVGRLELRRPGQPRSSGCGNVALECLRLNENDHAGMPVASSGGQGGLPAYFSMPSNSTSKINTLLGGITGLGLRSP
jgi:hypothetical protein